VHAGGGDSAGVHDPRQRYRHLRRGGEREFFIDNLLVRVHFIIVMIRWTGLAPWEIEFPFPGGGDGAGVHDPRQRHRHLPRAPHSVTPVLSTSAGFL